MIKSRLKILLTEKGLTQRKLSELTGIRPATITGIVNNSIKQIPVDSVSKICKALNCDVGDLFYYEPEEILLTLSSKNDSSLCLLLGFLSSFNPFSWYRLALSSVTPKRSPHSFKVKFS